MMSQNCPLRDDLIRFLSGYPEAEACRKHLEGCSSCRAWVESFEKAVRARALESEPAWDALKPDQVDWENFEVEPPAGLIDLVMTKIGEEVPAVSEPGADSQTAHAGRDKTPSRTEQKWSPGVAALVDLARVLVSPRRLVVTSLLVMFASLSASCRAAKFFEGTMRGEFTLTPHFTLLHVLVYALIACVGLVVFIIQWLCVRGDERIRPLLGIMISLLVGVDAFSWIRLWQGRVDVEYPATLLVIDIIAYGAAVFTLASLVFNRAGLRTTLTWASLYFALIHVYWLYLTFGISHEAKIWRVLLEVWGNLKGTAQDPTWSYGMAFQTFALYGVALGVTICFMGGRSNESGPKPMTFVRCVVWLAVSGVAAAGLFVLFSASSVGTLARVLLLIPSALAFYGMAIGAAGLLRTWPVNVPTPRLQGPFWPTVVGVYVLFLLYAALGPVAADSMTPWRLLALVPGLWLVLEWRSLRKPISYESE